MSTKHFLGVFFLTAAILIVSHAEAGDIRLIVRGDDLGMTQGSIIAFDKAFSQGILTCASIIVPAPWFEAAANLIRNKPAWCIGIHLTLVGEWKGYRWRPVLPWDQVKSLVDEDGFFYQDPEQLLSRKPSIKEIEAEWRAQINLALKRGVNVQYLDFHYMGPESYPGLDVVAKKIAKDYRLPVSGSLGEKHLPGIYTTPPDEKIDLAVKALENMEPGLWLWVFHPGVDSPEHRALIHSKAEDVFKGNGVGVHRVAETEALTSTRVKAVIKDRGIKLTNYGAISREMQESDYKKTFFPIPKMP